MKSTTCKMHKQTDGTESLEGFMTMVDNDDCRDFEDAETEEYEYREEE